MEGPRRRDRANRASSANRGADAAARPGAKLRHRMGRRAQGGRDPRPVRTRTHHPRTRPRTAEFPRHRNASSRPRRRSPHDPDAPPSLHAERGRAMSAALTVPVKAQTAAHALSPSQATTFLDCAARWYFAKVLALPDPQNGALSLGHAVHRTAAAVMRGKGANAGELPTLTDALEIFETVWQDELENAELAPDENQDDLASTGRRIVAKYHNQVAPDLMPAAVETTLTGKIGGIEVHAIADLITTDGIVCDLKTASKRPGKISADHAFQLATYAML